MKIPWHVIRLVLLIVAFAMAVVSGGSSTNTNELLRIHFDEWLQMSFAFLVVAPVLLVLVVAPQTLNPFLAKRWTKPTHESNPFDLRHPLSFFHFGAYFTLASGLGYVVVGAWTGTHVMAWGVALLCGGAGMLIGVKLCERLFKRRFERSPETDGIAE